MKEFLEEKLKYFKESREDLENKWRENYSVFKGNKADIGELHPSHFYDSENSESTNWESDVSIRLAKMKVLGATSLISDMLLKGGEIPFKLKPSARTKIKLRGMEESESEKLKNSISDFTRLIKNQMKEASVVDEMTTAIFNSAVYGICFMRKDFEEIEYEYFDELNNFAFTRGSKDILTFKSVPVFDMYWDAGGKFSDSSGYFEKSYLDKNALYLLLADEAYDAEVIRDVLEGKIGFTSTQTDNDLKDDSYLKEHNIELLEYYGRVPVIDGEVGEEVYAKVVMANREIIYTESIDKRDIPYLSTTFESHVDNDLIEGVVDNVTDMQKLYDEIFNTYIDNKKLAGNVMTAVKQRYLEDDDALENLHPGKVIAISEECQDVRQAIQPVIIPDVSEGLFSLLQYTEKMTDEVSMIPRSAMGQSTGGVQTAYETSQLIEKAGKYVGKTIENFDRDIIKNIIKEYYIWNMQRDDNADIKGDFDVIAMGFSSFNDRVMKSRKMVEIMQLILSNENFVGEFNIPEFGRALARVHDMDIDEFIKTDEEKEAEQKRLQESPQYKLQQEMQELELEKAKASVDKIFADAEEKRALAEEGIQHAKRQAAEATKALADIQIAKEKIELEYAKINKDKDIQIDEDVDDDELIEKFSEENLTF